MQGNRSTSTTNKLCGRLAALLTAMALLLGVQLVSGPAASATPASISLQQTGINGDAVEVKGLAAARDVDTDYWLDFGPTTDYGQHTAHQTLPAGPDQQLTFRITGLARGQYHGRLVGDTDPNATAAGGYDFTFTAPGISFRVTTSRATGDGVGITAAVAARSDDTDYWVEYGQTTAYGQQTPHETVPADSIPPGEERTLYFVVSGMSGEFHVRLLAQSPGMSQPDVGQEFTFTTDPNQSAMWPACTADHSTECVQSFTIDGRAVPGFHAEVRVQGGGLQLQAVSDRGTQELLYAGSPVSATSTVQIVVNAGDYDTGVIVADGYVSTARADATSAGNVLTYAASPQRTSFVRSGCTIGACGDDTTRGDDDYAGRVVAAAFPPNGDAAYVAASRGMWLSSNAQSSSTPSYDPATGAVRVTLAGPHLTSAGDVNQGFYQAFLPTRVFTDLWHVDGPGEVQASVSSDGSTQNGNQSWTAVDGGWIFTLRDFHYSSPTITLVPLASNPGTGGGASAPSGQGGSTGGSPATAPSPDATPSDGPSPTPAPASSSSPPVEAPAVPCLSVRVEQGTINATGLSSVTVTGARPGDSIQIQGYSQNHYGSASFDNDPTPVDAGVDSARGAALLADDSGSYTFSGFRPASNTRFRARVAGGRYCGNTAVQSVAAQETLKVVRAGARRYTFSGISMPARPGGLIVSLYVVRSGTDTLVGQGRAGSGTSEGRPAAYSIAVTFSKRFAARETFVVKTGSDAQNVSGRSNERQVAIF